MKKRYKSIMVKTPLWINPVYNPFADKLPFFVIEMGEFHCGNGHYYEGFEQAEHIMIYTISGSANLRYHDKDYVLCCGTLVILNGMDYHFYKNEIDTPWVFRKIVFDGASANVFNELINATGLKIINYPEKDFNDIFVNLVNCLKENSIDSIIKTSMDIFGLLSKCVEHTSNCDLGALGITKDIKDIINYINTKYNTKITLDDLLRFSNISKCNLIKRFKKQVGFTPYEYILKVRLTKAKHLLRNTEKSIREISEDVGIADEGSFNKQFKKIAGCTPNKYRMENSRI